MENNLKINNLNHFAVNLKLMQYCKLNTFQLKIAKLAAMNSV